jgi:hypothetical protein
MILALAVPMILFALLLLTKKKLVRKDWYVLFLVGFVFALLVSFISVWSTWNPPASSDYLHYGSQYSGASSLSYPLQMNVYFTPIDQLVQLNQTLNQTENEIGIPLMGNASFNVFIAGEKILGTNGTFTYDAIMGTAPVNYQLGSPFFSNTVYFFEFLLLIFTLFNLAGFALGMILCYAVSRTPKIKKMSYSAR